MNRIIVIGNGFDKAHGLATGYKDFINAYWNEFGNEICRKYSDWKKGFTDNELMGVRGMISHEDEFVRFEIFRSHKEELSIAVLAYLNKGAYNGILEKLNSMNDGLDGPVLKVSLRTTFNNTFFEHISSKANLKNWLDIENEYYVKLKMLLAESDTETRGQKVLKLNQEFDAVKKALERYLTKIVEYAKIQEKSSIKEAFKYLIEPKEIAHGKRESFFKSIVHVMGIISDDGMKLDFEDNKEDYMFLSKEESVQHYLKKMLKTDKFKEYYCHPSETLLLNFNYTDIAERLYGKDCKEVIHIHGELGNPHNPIIFGYGDELDDDYRQIEKLQDNDFLENIKSIRYHETGNYRNLLSFLEADLYQVVIMGHSCGNSDRTLLNTLFEHPNCASVKVYYHQIDENTDNYSQIVRNISRNFNDKAAMRDKVVNKELCTPLVPIQKE